MHKHKFPSLAFKEDIKNLVSELAESKKNIRDIQKSGSINIIENEDNEILKKERNLKEDNNNYNLIDNVKAQKKDKADEPTNKIQTKRKEDILAKLNYDHINNILNKEHVINIINEKKEIDNDDTFSISNLNILNFKNFPNFKKNILFQRIFKNAEEKEKKSRIEKYKIKDEKKSKNKENNKDTGNNNNNNNNINNNALTDSIEELKNILKNKEKLISNFNEQTKKDFPQCNRDTSSEYNSRNANPPKKYDKNNKNNNYNTYIDTYEKDKTQSERNKEKNEKINNKTHNKGSEDYTQQYFNNQNNETNEIQQPKYREHSYKTETQKIETNPQIHYTKNKTEGEMKKKYDMFYENVYNINKENKIKTSVNSFYCETYKSKKQKKKKKENNNKILKQITDNTIAEKENISIHKSSLKIEDINKTDEKENNKKTIINKEKGNDEPISFFSKQHNKNIMVLSALVRKKQKSGKIKRKHSILFKNYLLQNYKHKNNDNEENNNKEDSHLNNQNEKEIEKEKEKDNSLTKTSLLKKQQTNDNKNNVNENNNVDKKKIKKKNKNEKNFTNCKNNKEKKTNKQEGEKEEKKKVNSKNNDIYKKEVVNNVLSFYNDYKKKLDNLLLEEYNYLQNIKEYIRKKIKPEINKQIKNLKSNTTHDEYKHFEENEEQLYFQTILNNLNVVKEEIDFSYNKINDTEKKNKTNFSQIDQCEIKFKNIYKEIERKIKDIEKWLHESNRYDIEKKKNILQNENISYRKNYSQLLSGKRKRRCETKSEPILEKEYIHLKKLNNSEELITKNEYVKRKEIKNEYGTCLEKNENSFLNNNSQIGWKNLLNGFKVQKRDPVFSNQKKNNANKKRNYIIHDTKEKKQKDTIEKKKFTKMEDEKNIISNTGKNIKTENIHQDTQTDKQNYENGIMKNVEKEDVIGHKSVCRKDEEKKLKEIVTNSISYNSTKTCKRKNKNEKLYNENNNNKDNTINSVFTNKKELEQKDRNDETIKKLNESFLFNTNIKCKSLFFDSYLKHENMFNVYSSIPNNKDKNVIKLKPEEMEDSYDYNYTYENTGRNGNNEKERNQFEGIYQKSEQNGELHNESSNERYSEGKNKFRKIKTEISSNLFNSCKENISSLSQFNGITKDLKFNLHNYEIEENVFSNIYKKKTSLDSAKDIDESELELSRTLEKRLKEKKNKMKKEITKGKIFKKSENSFVSNMENAPIITNSCEFENDDTVNETYNEIFTNEREKDLEEKVKNAIFQNSYQPNASFLKRETKEEFINLLENQEKEITLKSSSLLKEREHLKPTGEKEKEKEEEEEEEEEEQGEINEENEMSGREDYEEDENNRQMEMNSSVNELKRIIEEKRKFSLHDLKDIINKKNNICKNDDSLPDQSFIQNGEIDLLHLEEQKSINYNLLSNARGKIDIFQNSEKMKTLNILDSNDKEEAFKMKLFKNESEILKLTSKQDDLYNTDNLFLSCAYNKEEKHRLKLKINNLKKEIEDLKKNSINNTESVNSSLSYKFEKPKKTISWNSQQNLNTSNDKLTSLNIGIANKNIEKNDFPFLKEKGERSNYFENIKQISRDNSYEEIKPKKNIKSNRRRSSFIESLSSIQEENQFLENTENKNYNNLKFLPLHSSLLSLNVIANGKNEKDRKLKNNDRMKNSQNSQNSQNLKNNFYKIYNYQHNKYSNERHLFSTNSSNFDEDNYEQKMLKENLDYIKKINECNSFISLSSVSYSHKEEEEFFEKMKMLETKIIEGTHYLPCILCNEYMFKLENVTNEEFSILGNNETLRTENYVCTICKHKRNMKKKFEEYFIIKEIRKEKKKQEITKTETYNEEFKEQSKEQLEKLFKKNNSTEKLNIPKKDEKDGAQSENLQKNLKDLCNSNIFHKFINSTSLNQQKKQKFEKEESVTTQFSNEYDDNLFQEVHNFQNEKQVKETITPTKDLDMKQKINKLFSMQKKSSDIKPEKYYNILSFKEMFNAVTNDKDITKQKSKKEISNYEKIDSYNSNSKKKKRNIEEIKKRETFDEQLLNPHQLKYDDGVIHDRNNFDKDDKINISQFDEEDSIYKYLEQKYERLLTNEEDNLHIEDFNDESLKNEKKQFHENALKSFSQIPIGNSKNIINIEEIKEQKQTKNFENLFNKSFNDNKKINFNESSDDNIFKKQKNYSNINTPSYISEYETNDLNSVQKKERTYTLIKNGFNKLKYV